MRRLGFLLTCMLAACATARPYGNFLENTSQAAQQALALDATLELRRAYSPASTTLALADAHDPFGQALVGRLRGMGFAVAEAGVAAKRALVVEYVVDNIGVDFLRTTLVLRRADSGAMVSRMSRAYAASAAKPRPAGRWTRQTP